MPWLMQQLEYLIPILVAAFLGAVIGFERKKRSKEAGIRTHALVCMGSALMMVISKHAFSDSGDFDAARVAAQIVTGIGFLGAGTIVFKNRSIHGLTTAAGIWTAAGVGMASGGGLYVLAAGATVLVVFIQFVLHIDCKLLSTRKIYRLHIYFKNDNDEANEIKDLFEVKHFHQVHISRDNGSVTCDVTIDTPMLYSSERLNKIIKDHPYIISIHRIEED